MPQADRRVLVTGATGYVGGRLTARLVQSGYSVRALVRDRERLAGRAWSAQVEIVEGDIRQPETLPAALAGVTTAYYLIQVPHGGSEAHDRAVVAARRFGQAAREAGVRRIIHLAALAPPAPNGQLSDSVGSALAESGVPVTELRASLIIGSGSVAFEMVRNLTECAPIMFLPRWVNVQAQPIAIRDVLSYLLAVLAAPTVGNSVIEIGGPGILSFADMIRGYARARGLKRLFVPVPAWLPRLSALLISWLTPIPSDIAQPLIAGLRGDVVVHDHSALSLFPAIKPLDYDTALLLAVERTESGQVETSWSDALATSQPNAPVVPLSAVTMTMSEGVIIEQRQRRVNAPPEQVFRIFAGLGGQRGWLAFDWAWRARGIIDRLAGGAGVGRGRRNPDELHAGDALDFWRVEAVEEGRLLRLRAEMRVPGRAWLEFQITPQGDGSAFLTQRAFFVPKGLPGLAYWFVLYPIHSLIFSGLIREIAQLAEIPQRLRADVQA